MIDGRNVPVDIAAQHMSVPVAMALVGRDGAMRCRCLCDWRVASMNQVLEYRLQPLRTTHGERRGRGTERRKRSFLGIDSPRMDITARLSSLPSRNSRSSVIISLSNWRKKKARLAFLRLPSMARLVAFLQRAEAGESGRQIIMTFRHHGLWSTLTEMCRVARQSTNLLSPV